MNEKVASVLGGEKTAAQIAKDIGTTARQVRKARQYVAFRGMVRREAFEKVAEKIG